MFFLCFVVLVFLPYRGFGQQCGSCPKDFSYRAETNKCYSVVATKQTWNEAFTACNKLGSHLVIPGSASELKVITDLIKDVKSSCIHSIMKKPGFWCSGRRICPNEFAMNPNTGLWLDISYINWLKGEPNNQGGNEGCVHLLAYDDKGIVYNDIPCDIPNCYICETNQK